MLKRILKENLGVVSGKHMSSGLRGWTASLSTFSASKVERPHYLDALYKHGGINRPLICDFGDLT